jgi:hypothetical protein
MDVNRQNAHRVLPVACFIHGTQNTNTLSSGLLSWHLFCDKQLSSAINQRLAGMIA